MAGNFNISTVVLPQSLGDSENVVALVAPSAALGGGLRIKYGYAVEEASGQGAGTAYALSLLKYDSGGTLAGTIAPNVGGTASPLVAGVKQAFAIDDEQAFVKAGETVKIAYVEQGSTTNPVRGSVVIGWEPGN
jgi:hypothetical protein